MYDYGWRQYMPDIGRWNGMDQLSEMYAPISPYAYVANNPISFTDPDGRKIKPIYQDGKIVGYEFTEGDAVAAGGYLKAGGDWAELFSQVDGYGGNFGSGPLSNFWNTFNSNGVMIKTITTALGGSSRSSDGSIGLAENVITATFTPFGEWVSGIYLGDFTQNNDKNDNKYFDQFMWGGGILDLVYNHKTYKTNKGVVKNIYKNGKPISRRAANFARASKLVKGIGVAGFFAGVLIDGSGVYSYYKDPTSSNAVHPVKAGVNTAMGALGFTGWGTPASLLYGTAEAFHPQGAEGALRDMGEIQRVHREQNNGAGFKPQL